MVGQGGAVGILEADVVAGDMAWEKMKLLESSRTSSGKIVTSPETLAPVDVVLNWIRAL